MYGLLSSAYNSYRINNSTVDRERFRAGKASMKNNLSWSARGFLIIFEIFLTIIALLALFDTYQVKNWNIGLFVLILILFFIPVVGDLTAIFIIVYWLVSIRPQSQLLSAIGPLRAL